ncbi:PREDICTED: uncharacterized protein LOC106815369 [Priapulus caudatus]|uniref:Uncharacterized protein LOC106815369 n=1 Tax=Priapulus caudatus TaxID=37621 RepID=A0ABM1ESY6_PRICU|nr:PREDICTED: uncharacterized protein LOC106815369 [Priapulus caudatus]
MAAIGCSSRRWGGDAAEDHGGARSSSRGIANPYAAYSITAFSIQQPSSRPDSKGLLQVAAAAATAAAAAADATQPASQPTQSPPQVAPVQPAATFTTFQAPVSTATVRPAQLQPGRHDDAAGHSRQSSIQSNSSSSSTITSGGVASVAPPRGGGARRPTTGELARALKTRERAKHRSLPSADYGGATNQSLPDLRVAAAADGRSLTAGGAAALPHSLSAGSLRDLSDTAADVRLSPQQGIVGPRSASVRDVEPTGTGTPPGGDGESLASRINSIDVDATDAYGGSPEGTYSVRYGTTVREGEGAAAAAAEEDGGATSREAEKQLQLLFTSRLREREMLARQRAEMSRCKMAPPSHAHRDAGDTCCVSSEPCAMNGRDDASKQERVFRDDADADEDEPRVNVREMAAIFERSKQANICGRGAAAERLEATDAAVKRVANYCTLPRQRDKPTPPSSSSSSARRVTFSDQVALCSDSDADSVTSAPAAAGARPKPALKTSRRLVGGAGGGIDPQQEDATRPLYSYPGAPWNPRPSADEFQYTLSGTGHYRNGRAVEVVAAATTRPLAPLPTEGQRSEGFRGARVPADVVRYSIHAPPAGGAASAVNGALNQSYDSAGVHVPRCHGNEPAAPPDGQHESGCSTLPRKGAPAYAAGYRDDDDADGGDLYIDRKAAIRRRYQGELRVDIPDAVVAATKRDSGYRSGDRNSTGSTSSSTESPPGTDLPLPPGTGHAHSMTALMQWYVQRSSGPVEPRRLAEAAPPGGAGAPVRAIHYNFVDSRLHGSAESFASLSSGGGGAVRCRAEDANSLTSLEKRKNSTD